MILTTGNIKGGVGKTTLTLNLAIARARAGRNVLLVDGDAQRSAMTFTEIRSEQMNGDPGYTAVPLEGPAIITQVKKLSPNYDDVLIDCGGRDTGSLRAALNVSDMLLIPTQPRSLDIWSAQQMGDVVAEARALNPRLQVALVINVADAQGTDNEAATDALKEMTGFTVLPFTIGRRKAFANAVSDGRAVIEQTPKDNKAIQELGELVAALFTPALVEA